MKMRGYDTLEEDNRENVIKRIYQGPRQFEKYIRVTVCGILKSARVELYSIRTPGNLIVSPKNLI